MTLVGNCKADPHQSQSVKRDPRHSTGGNSFLSGRNLTVTESICRFDCCMDDDEISCHFVTNFHVQIVRLRKVSFV